MTAMQNNPHISQSDLEDLNFVLGDLEILATDAESIEEIVEGDEVVEDDGPGEGEIVEEVEVVQTAGAAELDDNELRDLDIGIEKALSYESQTADAADPAEISKAKAAAAKPQKTQRTAKSTSSPRTPRDVCAVAAEFFVLTGDPSTMGEADLEAHKTATRALIPEQKKVAEKFDNLFTSLSVGKAPSTYVMMAFELLDQKKSVTSIDIVSAYKTVGAKSPTEGYNEGTARSQCGQVMNLFATVGIAKRVGQTLQLNDDSLIAQRLREVSK